MNSSKKMKNSAGKLPSFLISQILSLFSEELIRFALPAVYLMKSGNAYGSSILYCCILGPRIFLGPFLAYLSDNFPPHLVFRRVILGQTILMGVLPLIFFLFSSLSLWLWGFAAFALSVFNSIQFGAVQTILPQFSKGKNLLKANGLLASFDSLALFLAPLCAGFLLDASGFAILCYVATFINFIAFFLQNRVSTNFTGEHTFSRSDKNAWTTGWSFILKNSSLIFNLLLTCPVNLLLAICLAILTPFVLQNSEHQAHVLGIIMSMGTIGQFLGGFSCRYLGSHVSTKWILYVGFMISGTLGLLVMGFLPTTVGLSAGLFFCGFGISWINASNQTIWQTICPDSIRGTVIAARRSVNTCLGPVGFLMGIPLASLLTPITHHFTHFTSYSFLFIICGLLLLFLGILGLFFKIDKTQNIRLEEKKCQPEKDF